MKGYQATPVALKYYRGMILTLAETGGKKTRPLTPPRCEVIAERLSTQSDLQGSTSSKAQLKKDGYLESTNEASPSENDWLLYTPERTDLPDTAIQDLPTMERPTKRHRKVSIPDGSDYLAAHAGYVSGSLDDCFEKSCTLFNRNVDASGDSTTPPDRAFARSHASLAAGNDDIANCVFILTTPDKVKACPLIPPFLSTHDDPAKGKKVACFSDRRQEPRFYPKLATSSVISKLRRPAPIRICVPSEFLQPVIQGSSGRASPQESAFESVDIQSVPASPRKFRLMPRISKFNETSP
jgi:hypothetical protein